MRLGFRGKLFFGFFSFAIVLSTTISLLLLQEGDRATGEGVSWILRPVAFILAASLVGSFFASILIAGRLNRSVRLLERGLREVGEGNLESSPGILRTHDEFEQLLESFHEMIRGLRERDRLQRSLRIVQNQFRALAAGAPIGLFQTDALGRIVFVNDRWCEITGLSRREALGDGWTNAIHPDDREKLLADWAASVESRSEFNGEFRFLHPDGRHRNLRGSAWHWSDGESRISGRFGVFFDLTLRRRLEEERERLFSSSLDLICLAGTDGFFREVNPAFEKFLGRRREETLSRPFVEFLVPEDVPATLEAVRTLAQGHPVASFENRAISGDGAVRWIEWTAFPVAEGTLFYAIGRDVTDRRRAEEAERTLLATKIQIDLAKRIQESLLPKSSPSWAGFDVAAASHPADIVGGDYFDFIDLGNGRRGIVVGDAAGHGLGPALLMAQVRASLRCLVGGDLDVEEILKRANGVLHDGSPDDGFVTLVFVELDLEKRTIRHASCGHPSAWVLDSSGRVKAELASTCIPLGCFPTAGVQVGPKIELEDGDVLLLVTDGIPEAESPSEEMFGQERLLALARANLGEPATRIVEILDQAVHDHSQCVPGADDITSVVLKVLPRATG
jgi:PAS domain S-box-containing protein